MSIETVKACVKRIAALFPLNIGREPKYGLAIKGAGYGRKARFQNGIFYTCRWERRYSEENTQVKIAY